MDWTLHTTVQVPYPLVTRTWAPEFFKDPRTGKTHIIVSLGETLTDFEAYLYTATDDTFLNWGAPQPMVGIGPNYIDTFIVYKPSADGKVIYHAFSKNESAKYIEHATALSVAGPWTFVQTGKTFLSRLRITVLTCIQVILRAGEEPKDHASRRLAALRVVT